MVTTEDRSKAVGWVMAPVIGPSLRRLKVTALPWDMNGHQLISESLKGTRPFLGDLKERSNPVWNLMAVALLGGLGCATDSGLYGLLTCPTLPRRLPQKAGSNAREEVKVKLEESASLKGV